MIGELATVAGAGICLTTLFNKKVSGVLKGAATLGLVSLAGTYWASAAADGMGSSALGMVPFILGGAGLSALSTVFCLGGLTVSLGKSSPDAAKKDDKPNNKPPSPHQS